MSTSFSSKYDQGVTIPVSGDAIPYLSDPAGTPAVKMADVNNVGLLKPFSITFTDAEIKILPITNMVDSVGYVEIMAGVSGKLRIPQTLVVVSKFAGGAYSDVTDLAIYWGPQDAYPSGARYGFGIDNSGLGGIGSIDGDVLSNAENRLITSVIRVPSFGDAVRGIALSTFDGASLWMAIDNGEFVFGGGDPANTLQISGTYMEYDIS